MVFKLIRDMSSVQAVPAQAVCEAVTQEAPELPVSRFVEGTAQLRETVCRALLAGQRISSRHFFRLESPVPVSQAQLDYGSVSTERVIVTHAGAEDVLLVQEPFLERGSVSWRITVTADEAPVQSYRL